KPSPVASMTMSGNGAPAVLLGSRHRELVPGLGHTSTSSVLSFCMVFMVQEEGSSLPLYTVGGLMVMFGQWSDGPAIQPPGPARAWLKLSCTWGVKTK